MARSRTAKECNITLKVLSILMENSKILHDIEEYLLRELGLEGYKLCNGHLLETSVGATRQQYHIDFRLNSKNKFVIIPLERGQQLEINHGGEQMSYHLKD